MPPVTEIPYEAGETVSFTPASLANIAGAPVFTLRSPTKRDERHHRRVMREEGVKQHSDEAMRAEIYAALEHIWSDEDRARHEPRIRAFYSAIDDFALQRKDDPDLKWEFDPAEEQAVRKVITETMEAWPATRRMIADNIDANELRAPLIAAVVVKDWSGLDVKRILDRGYLSVDCAENLIEALEAFELDHGLEAGVAGSELFVACMRRMYLGEEELGNSESSPPSPAPRTSSKKSAANGKSRKSARSRKTPATA